MTLALAGFVAGAAAGIAVGLVIVGRQRRDDRVENRGLRVALRYMRNALRRDPHMWHLAVYADAFLDDEAGA